MLLEFEPSWCYACFGVVSQKMGNHRLADESLRMAREVDPANPIVCLLNESEKIAKRVRNSIGYFHSESLFDMGCSESIRSGGYYDALNFALMRADNNLKALAYEALGNLKSALEFADDESVKKRLTELLNPRVPSAEECELETPESGYDLVAAGLGAMESNDRQRAEELAVLAKSKLPKLEKQIDRVFLKSGLKLESSFVEKDAEIYFLKLLDDYGKWAAVKKTASKFQENAFFRAAQLMWIVGESKKISAENEKAALKFDEDFPCYNSCLVLAGTFLRRKKWAEARTCLSRLCIMRPNVMHYIVRLLNRLSQLMDPE
jgi:tetratricopeptide (TPR) repeat protein